MLVWQYLGMMYFWKQTRTVSLAEREASMNFIERWLSFFFPPRMEFIDGRGYNQTDYAEYYSRITRTGNDCITNEFYGSRLGKVVEHPQVFTKWQIFARKEGGKHG